MNPGTLSSVEPSLVFAAGDRASNGAAVVSVDVRDSGLVMTLSALSDSGVCFYVQDDLSASTSFASAVGGPSTCVAANTSDLTFTASW